MTAFNPEKCCFCPQAFANWDALVEHLRQHHARSRKEARAKQGLAFYVVKGRSLVVCVCGQSFTRDESCLPIQKHTNDWKAHVRREGGLVAHFDKLRWQQLLDFLQADKNAQSADDWLDALATVGLVTPKRDSLYRLIQQAAWDIKLDQLDVDGICLPE